MTDVQMRRKLDWALTFAMEAWGDFRDKDRSPELVLAAIRMLDAAADFMRDAVRAERPDPVEDKARHVADRKT